VTSGRPLDAPSWTVLLDLRSPACHLALPPAIAFAREFGLTTRWLPITVPPLRPPSEPAPGDDRSLRHRRHRARALARELETYARAQGLTLREPYRNVDASAFRLGWLWLHEQDSRHLEAYLTEGFRDYWALAFDPASVPDVATRLARLGATTAGFEAWCHGDGPERDRRVADEVRALGVPGAPAYLVEDEVFLGRQHLPMIRWILGGRRGPGPI